MKPPAALLCCLALFPAVLWPSALAAPRVGIHGGFTRVVFALPGNTAINTSLGGQHVTVRLGTALKAAHGPLSAPGVRAYAVKGHTVSLALTPGYSQATARVMAAAGARPARLVIDIPRQQPGAAQGRPTPGTLAAVSAAPPRMAAPPPAPTVIRTAASRAARPRVVIDPGHGGVDPGMTSRWVREKEVTLDVGLRVRKLLRARGVEVVMTRDSDRDLSADKVTDLDRRSGMAKTDKVAAYISIHVNAGGSAGAEGIETYYFGQPLSGSNRSLAVAENGGGSVGRNLTRKAADKAQNMLGDILAQAKIAFSRQLAQKVQSSLLAHTGAANRGVHTDAFYVIRDPRTAAILTEVGFGSSPHEGPRLATPAYRQKIAEGIAQAILSFLHMD